MNATEWLTVQNLVFLAGVLHFCQIPAMIMAPKMLSWQEDLAKLSVINRRIVKVIGLAIVITVVGLGVVVSCASGDLVNHSRLAIGMTAFLTVFWAYRAAVQFFLYLRIWAQGWLGHFSNYALAALFTFLTLAYLVAFISNVRSG